MVWLQFVFAAVVSGYCCLWLFWCAGFGLLGFYEGVDCDCFVSVGLLVLVCCLCDCSVVNSVVIV